MVRCLCLISVCLLALVVACSGVQKKKETFSFEAELAASGFQKQPADTAEKLARLEELPQQKILSQERDGTTEFLYADATDCKCLYVGTDADHKRFRELLVEKQKEEQVEAAQHAIDAQWLDTEAFAGPSM